VDGNVENDYHIVQVYVEVINMYMNLLNQR
jgi:hypothetical protein